MDKSTSLLRVKNIISVQSTVLNDLVGNQAARYILSDKNYNFYEIPTVILTSHKAHKTTIQLHSKNLNPWKIFSSIKKTYNLNKQDLTIVGYTPNLQTSKSISKIIKNQKRILLDPVMGDVGVGLYISKDVAQFFRKVVTKVSFISANFFEWSYLNYRNINNYELPMIIKDLKIFSKMYKTQLLIRSIPYKGKLLNILCHKNEIWGITTPKINFKNRFHGAGDLSTALYAHHINEKVSLKKILESVTGDIFNILAKRRLASSRRTSFKAKNLNNL